MLIRAAFAITVELCQSLFAWKAGFCLIPHRALTGGNLLKIAMLCPAVRYPAKA